MTTIVNNKSTVSESLVRAGLFAIIAAVLVGVVTFLVATQVFNVNVLMPDGTTMPFFAVVGASFMGALGATLVLTALRRFTARPVSIFRIIAIVFLVFSLIPPLTMPGLDNGTRLSMIAMHITVGAAVIGVLTTQVKE
jgi:hypothetical protein